MWMNADRWSGRMSPGGIGQRGRKATWWARPPRWGWARPRRAPPTARWGTSCWATSAWWASPSARPARCRWPRLSASCVGLLLSIKNHLFLYNTIQNNFMMNPTITMFIRLRRVNLPCSLIFFCFMLLLQMYYLNKPEVRNKRRRLVNLKLSAKLTHGPTVKLWESNPKYQC